MLPRIQPCFVKSLRVLYYNYLSVVHCIFCGSPYYGKYAGVIVFLPKSSSSSPHRKQRSKTICNREVILRWEAHIAPLLRNELSTILSLWPNHERLSNKSQDHDLFIKTSMSSMSHEYCHAQSDFTKNPCSSYGLEPVIISLQLELEKKT